MRDAAIVLLFIDGSFVAVKANKIPMCWVFCTRGPLPGFEVFVSNILFLFSCNVPITK